jgi:hypothetical protein
MTKSLFVPRWFKYPAMGPFIQREEALVFPFIFSKERGIKIDLRVLKRDSINRIYMVQVMDQ